MGGRTREDELPGRRGVRRGGRGRTAAHVLRHPLPADRADDGRAGGRAPRRRAALAEHDRPALQATRASRRSQPGRLCSPRGRRRGAGAGRRPAASTPEPTATNCTPRSNRCAAASLRWRWRRPRGFPSSPNRRPTDDDDSQRARAVVSALDPSFRAQELSWVVSQVALNTDFAAAADRRSWLERLLGPPARRAARPAGGRHRARRGSRRAQLAVAAQQPARRGGARTGRAGRRPERGPARVLGRVRHPVGAALQRPQHRPERACARCWAQPPASSSAGRWWR